MNKNIYETLYRKKINIIIDNYKLILSLLSIDNCNFHNNNNILILILTNYNLIKSLNKINFEIKKNNLFYFVCISNTKINLIKIKLFIKDKDDLIKNDELIINFNLLEKYIKYLINKFTKLNNLII